MKNEFILLVAMMVYILSMSYVMSTKESEKLSAETVAKIEATVIGNEVIWDFDINEDYYENKCAFSMSLIKSAKEYCSE